MRKTIGYSFLTSTLAYLFATIILVILYARQTGWSRIDYHIITFIMSGLTLGLSEFRLWGDFNYLASLVPWLGSSLVLTLLMRWFNSESKRRRLLGGLSIFAYYFVMFLVFIIMGLIVGWGDIAYSLLILWPLVGFGLGYLAVVIAEKVLKYKFA